MAVEPIPKAVSGVGLTRIDCLAVQQEDIRTFRPFGDGSDILRRECTWLEALEKGWKLHPKDGLHIDLELLVAWNYAWATLGRNWARRRDCPVRAHARHPQATAKRPLDP